MRKIVCSLLFVTSLFATHEIDELVQELISLMEVPGAAVGIIVDDEVVLAKGYGTRNEAKGLPVTTKTLFPIGSGTKPFTAFLIGQLVDEGVLRWDDPVSDRIPYFKLKDPYTTSTITIRDYLTHMSGYPRHDGIWYHEHFSREEMIRKLRFLDPLHKLREKFLYQNIGYMIVGHVAEVSLQKNFETLLVEKIFQPLGMTHSTLSLTTMQNGDNFSIGYKAPSEPIPYIDAETITPAGGLNSSIEDLLKWLRLLLHRGDGLIESATFNEIITPQVASNLACNGRYGVENEVIIESYGLGWIIVSYRGHLLVFHGGNIDGFSSVTAFLPREGIGIVVLCNKHLSPFPPILATTLIDKLLHLPPIDWAQKYKDLVNYNQEEFTRHQEKNLTERHLNTTPSHNLLDYQGSYYNPTYGSLKIKLVSDKLVATFNQLQIPLMHWHYDVFEVDSKTPIHIMRGVKFSFHQNLYGDIKSVIIPLEPQAEGIVFMKEKDDTLLQKEYLDQFIGSYSYLGFTFLIENTNEKLTVKAFGQPPYELFPERHNLFTVKGWDGYTVQFLSDESGAITGVQLVQPNSSTYTAKKL